MTAKINIEMFKKEFRNTEHMNEAKLFTMVTAYLAFNPSLLDEINKFLAFEGYKVETQFKVRKINDTLF